MLSMSAWEPLQLPLRGHVQAKTDLLATVTAYVCQQAAAATSVRGCAALYVSTSKPGLGR